MPTVKGAAAPAVPTHTSAPVSATAAYTTLLTKRVQGLVSEEKKIALSEQAASCSLPSSKSASERASWPNALTTFWLPIISSISAVWLARFSDCCLNRS